MTAVPFEDASYDGITAVHSMIHVPIEQHERVTEECARTLRPNGWLPVSDGQATWEGTNPDWLETGVEMSWSITGTSATEARLRRTGFTVTDEIEAAGDEQWVFIVARLDA